jgi:DNA-binding XRE family transcriptional regulator
MHFSVNEKLTAFCGHSMGWRINLGMRKSIHSPEYQHVLTALVAMREKAGMTQRDLAKKLGREHSFVWRIETGERRLDVIEFHWVCKALGQDASEVYRSLIRSVKKTAPIRRA